MTSSNGPESPERDRDASRAPGPAFLTSATALAPRPWYSRAVVLVPAIAILLIIAIAIPIIVHVSNIRHGDELAETFLAQLDDYRATWSTERIDAATAVDLSSAEVAGAPAFYVLTSPELDAIRSQCADVADAAEATGALDAAQAPQLPVDERAEASTRYRDAAAASDELAGGGQSRADFIAAAETSIGDAEQYCTNLPKFNSIDNAFRNALAEVMPAALVVRPGDTIDAGGGNTIGPCEAQQGCPNFIDRDARLQFADALDRTYTDYYRGLADQYRTGCILDRLADACTAAADGYADAAGKLQAATDHLRNTEPTNDAGQPPYPEFTNTLMPAAYQAEDAANAAVVSAWATVDPQVSDLAGQGASLARIFAENRAAAERLAGAVQR